MSDKKLPLPSSILFLCSQNAVRSPMAAGIMKKLYGSQLAIDSAGVETKDIDGYAVTVMNEIDINLAQHVSAAIEPNYMASFDLVICFSKGARDYAQDICRAIATEFEFWPVYDPVNQAEDREEQLGHYRKLRDELDNLLKSKFVIK
ncbi:MAG: low molecular weight phosphatase family protein [Hyphomicrobiales bacterium]